MREAEISNFIAGKTDATGLPRRRVGPAFLRGGTLVGAAALGAVGVLWWDRPPERPVVVVVQSADLPPARDDAVVEATRDPDDVLLVHRQIRAFLDARKQPPAHRAVHRAAPVAVPIGCPPSLGAACGETNR